MTIEELRFINRVIKVETLRYCRGLVPSLDMVGSLAVVLAEKTRNIASPCVTGKTWIDVVYNTIESTIRKEVAVY